MPKAAKAKADIKTASASEPGFGLGHHLYLIDGSGYIFRAYHALPPLTRKSDGLPIGAVAGFSNMLWKLLEDNKAGDRPTHIAVIFDAGRATFRDAIYSEYKANRSETPEDLIPQFPLVRDATRAFGVSCIERDGYEADDIIATYARRAARAGGKVTIVSSDKDLMQLVDDGKVAMFDPVKGRRIGSVEVAERFGVTPDKVVQVQALMGDSVDNVPGVPGIGVKTAAELIGIYGDLETLLARAGEIKQPKRREALIAHADNARMSLKLVTLDDDVPMDDVLESFLAREPDPKALTPFLQTMEFTTLLKRVTLKMNEGAGGAVEVAGLETPSPITELPASVSTASSSGPGAVVDRALYLKAIDYAQYQTVSDRRALDRVILLAREFAGFGLSVETSSSDPMQAELIGLSLALGPGQAFYIPLRHRAAEGLALAGGPSQLSESEALAALKPLFEDESLLKLGHNIKFAYGVLRQRGIVLAPTDDPMLMSYVLDAGLHGHGLEELSELYLQHKPIALSDVTGKGRDRVPFEQVSLEQATRFSAENADIAVRLSALLKPRLVAERRMTVYETLERPLIPVLAEMEREGIAIAPDFLAKLSNDFALICDGLQTQIHKLAGEDFNLGSPKQLGDILFGKFSLPGGRRTKTGAWSTDADILEELAAQGSRDSGTHSAMAAIVEIEIDLYRRAAAAHQPGNAPHSHLLCAGRDHDRPLVLDRAQFAEHSYPHRRRPSHPPGFRRPKGPRACFRRLQPDRTAHSRPYGRGAGVDQSLCRRARHSCHDGIRNVRRANEGHDRRNPARREGGQFRNYLRHFGFRPGQPARHPAQ